MSRKEKTEILTVPNSITFLRILGTIVLLFIKPLSVLFFVIYAFTGLTDALDGFVARKTGTQSDLGAKLDSVADLLFYTVMMIKILPVLIKEMPKLIWLFVALVLAIRLASYLVAAYKYHRFSSMHTYLNKLTGAAVFILPFMLITPVKTFYAFFAVSLGIAASLEELIIHFKSESYNASVKSLIMM